MASLFVDDIRPAPEGFLIARTVQEAKDYLSRDDIDMVSLDHDLGACSECIAAGLDIGDMQTPETTFMHWCPHAEDGASLAAWMVEHQRVPAVVKIHSMNPVGRSRIRAILGA